MKSLQNGKERKPTYNYLCKNENNNIMKIYKKWKKESTNHIYSDTSMVIVLKSDENQYCNKNVATLGATNFTSSIRGYYKLGGESSIYKNG